MIEITHASNSWPLAMGTAREGARSRQKRATEVT